MRSIFSLMNVGRSILMAACFALIAPNTGFADPPTIQKLSGTVTKVNAAGKSITVNVGKRQVELKRSDFDLVTLVRNGRTSRFNMDDAQLLKLSIKIEITTEEDKNGRKKKHLKIEIVNT